MLILDVHDWMQVRGPIHLYSLRERQHRGLDHLAILILWNWYQTLSMASWHPMQREAQFHSIILAIREYHERLGEYQDDDSLLIVALRVLREGGQRFETSLLLRFVIQRRTSIE
jgi:hypothetical protein